MIGTCATCKWWRSQIGHTNGECRRMPPTIQHTERLSMDRQDPSAPVNVETVAHALQRFSFEHRKESENIRTPLPHYISDRMWPIIEDNEWCGEYARTDATTLLHPFEAGRILGLSENRFNKLVKEGHGPPCITLPNGDVRYDPGDIWIWVRSIKNTPQS